MCNTSFGRTHYDEHLPHLEQDLHVLVKVDHGGLRGDWTISQIESCDETEVATLFFHIVMNIKVKRIIEKEKKKCIEFVDCMEANRLNAS